jgi:hypothetical protein
VMMVVLGFSSLHVAKGKVRWYQETFSPISYIDRVGSILCKWLDTSTKSLDSEVNKYYVPRIGWEVSDTANWSQVNCVVCQSWLNFCGRKLLYFHQYPKHETLHICGSWPSCDLMRYIDCGNL